jgi:SMODS-associated and fused to various effectors sensor domain
MANQVTARLSGDDYQHLYSWFNVLELNKTNSMVQKVTVEDADAGSVDDVTVQHKDHSDLPDRFYQIKYHVDQRSEYSTDLLIKSKPGGTSLLEKFWATWHLLQKPNSNRTIELNLVSNWTWSPDDKFKTCISGRDNSVKSDFLTASANSDLGKIKAKWLQALGIKNENIDFHKFVDSLRFRLGFDCAQELETRVSERMSYMGLKYDQSSLILAVGIVREWIKLKKQILTFDDLKEVLEKHNLHCQNNDERSISIYLSTIKPQKFDIPPDFLLDWCDYFAGDPYKKSHQLKDSTGWNSQLLPELKNLEIQVSQNTDCRLVKARGLSRLSAWFAFGFIFPEVGRYTIEVDQQGPLWRTNASPSSDFVLIESSNIDVVEGETLDGEGDIVAVGISISGSLDDDVRDYLQNRTVKVSSLLLVRPERELGRECLRSANDAVALASNFKILVRAFVKKWKARRLMLFYFGPLSGACFIGHQLNAICPEIQIMEDQQPGYAPSFLLR